MSIKVKTAAPNAPSNPRKRVHIPNLKQDRLGTLHFLSWWDREVVSAAKVLVVGAGALGNEVLKNLALMGVGNIYIVDMDEIEMANLSRSVLYRTEDNGRLKSQAAAARIREIDPDIRVYPLNGRVQDEIGAGFVRQMHVVIGCLDNREARWHINELCYRVGVPWVEGAIENLTGKMQVFDPRTEHACYNCTLSEQAIQEMSVRRSCKMYAQRDLLAGKVPTTSIAGSIVGAMQVQEALKLIHGMSDFIRLGREFRYNGFSNELDALITERRPECDCHYRYPEEDIYEVEDARAESVTASEILSLAEQELCERCMLRLGFDFILRGRCDKCGSERDIMKPLDRLKADDYTCPFCGKPDSLLINEFSDIVSRVTTDSAIASLQLAALGVPPLAILEVYTASGRLVLFELTGDRILFGL